MYAKINPAMLSKINWVNALAIAGTLAATFGFDITAAQQAAVVSLIALVTQGATIIFRTFMTAKPE